jgi:hypothetical protein
MNLYRQRAFGVQDLRVESRKGITNGIAMILVIVVVALPAAGYYYYFNHPITTAPNQQGSSTSSTTVVASSAGPAQGFVAGGVTCGYGLTYGSPGGEGCFVTMFNGGNSTATAAGTCNLTYGGNTYPGTFSYADPLGPGQSTGKVTCGESQEGPPAGAGTHVTGQIFLTDTQYVAYNGTAVS